MEKLCVPNLQIFAKEKGTEPLSAEEMRSFNVTSLG